jgi:hypothetical protein
MAESTLHPFAPHMTGRPSKIETGRAPHDAAHPLPRES